MTSDCYNNLYGQTTICCACYRDLKLQALSLICRYQQSDWLTPSLGMLLQLSKNHSIPSIPQFLTQLSNVGRPESGSWSACLGLPHRPGTSRAAESPASRAGLGQVWANRLPLSPLPAHLAQLQGTSGLSNRVKSLLFQYSGLGHSLGLPDNPGWVTPNNV